MAPQKIRIALDWTPNTIHSGLYVAIAKGFYQKHGLEVDLLPPDAAYTKTPAKRLDAGEVDLAICPSESCIAYNEGGKMKLQAIYAILQKDASAITTLNLNSIKELGSGKTYGSYNARYEDAIVQAMIVSDGGNGAEMQIERSQGKLSMFEALRKGHIDATWIFMPWEGVEAEMEGVKMKNFHLLDYDIPYGYSPVIARNASASLDAEVLGAFVAATREGYELAIEKPEEAVKALLNETSPRRSESFLRKSQQMINDFYSDGNKLGSMDETKWDAWLAWLKKNDLMTGPEEVKREDIFTNEFFQ